MANNDELVEVTQLARKAAMEENEKKWNLLAESLLGLMEENDARNMLGPRITKGKRAMTLENLERAVTVLGIAVIILAIALILQ